MSSQSQYVNSPSLYLPWRAPVFYVLLLIYSGLGSRKMKHVSQVD